MDEMDWKEWMEKQSKWRWESNSDHISLNPLSLSKLLQPQKDVYGEIYMIQLESISLIHPIIVEFMGKW